MIIFELINVILTIVCILNSQEKEKKIKNLWICIIIVLDIIAIVIALLITVMPDSLLYNVIDNVVDNIDAICYIMVFIISMIYIILTVISIISKKREELNKKILCIILLFFIVSIRQMASINTYTAYLDIDSHISGRCSDILLYITLYIGMTDVFFGLNF